MATRIVEIPVTKGMLKDLQAGKKVGWKVDNIEVYMLPTFMEEESDGTSGRPEPKVEHQREPAREPDPGSGPSSPYGETE